MTCEPEAGQILCMLNKICGTSSFKEPKEYVPDFSCGLPVLMFSSLLLTEPHLFTCTFAPYSQASIFFKMSL